MRMICFLILLVTCHVNPSYSQTDAEGISAAIENWDKAWETRDIEMALKDYADKTDWTNAFGMRVTSKEELRSLLERIFAMDFVMSGENNYGIPDIVFLSDDIATARSLNIRENQRWPDGSLMPPRRVAHLRVFRKVNGEWLIVNHMISQAHDTRGDD